MENRTNATFNTAIDDTDHEVINNIAVFISAISLVVTCCGLVICYTQQWKKRDGILLANVFVVDILFSCIAIPTNTYFIRSQSTITFSVSGILLSNVFVFLFLLSWVSQCVIAINRYVVIIFPFKYKKLLSWNRLIGCVYVMWVLIVMACIISSILNTRSQTQYLYKKDTSMSHFTMYQLIFMQVSKSVLVVLSFFHVTFLLLLLSMECYLWKIARGHRNRYRSITSSISNKEEPALNSLKDNPGCDKNNLRKRVSISTQHMVVRRTPFLILGVHLASIIPYAASILIYILDGINLFYSKFYSYTCLFLLIANSFRPIVNFFNHIPTKKLRKFRVLLQTLLNTQSAELCTDYYIENQKEVQKIFKLRRESAHSLVTEASVV